jgi:hypothetical protein|tara:strand:- start:108 stop:404 length:297 start_codon:yes stop_codon:yes gene_type:complete
LDELNMVVGILGVHGFVRESRSLKDKRKVVSSIKDRLKNKFNISIAEVDYQESHQQVGLGISMVGNDHSFVDSALNQVINHLRLHPVMELFDYEIEVV